MAHLKRLVAPKTWPIARKKTVFVTQPNPRVKAEFGIPLSMLLKDLLKVAKTNREVLRILRERQVLVNGKVQTQGKFPAGLFDVIEIPKLGKSYIVMFDRLGKLTLNEVKKPSHRLLRIENKTMISGGKLQLNLFGGTNVLAEKGEYKVGDAVKVSFPENKPTGTVTVDKGSKVLVIGGAHRGETATVKELDVKKTPKEVILKGDEGEFRTRFGNIHLIE